MDIFYYLLIFISGCFIGSFLKLTADHIVNGESFVFGRSKCEFCKVYLKPFNLIPVLSYFFQKGRCTSCEHKLSLSYPMSEITTGTLFLAASYYLDIFNNFNTYSLLYLIYILVVLSFYIIMIFSDIKYLIIPDKVVYTATLFVFVFITLVLFLDIKDAYFDVVTNPLSKYLIQAGFLKTQILFIIKNYLITLGSAVGIGLFFVSLILLTKGKGMGGGDVKLGFLIGLFNGFPYNILGIFLGFVIGSVFSLGLIGLKQKTMKDIIPFGPFLIAGSLASLFFGRYIINWYLGLI
jgi:prepilin signal peptidase PulO-like enzyme (type II secretory pathway)